MTAEIAILNRQAVALAADSAVTINYPGSPKVFNSVNKLFTLSKYAPVGVMVYGVAELTGVPWETIIKSFRRELGERRFARLEDYALELINYINNHKSMFSLEQQRQQVLSSVLRQFRSVLISVDGHLKKELARVGPIADARVKRIVNDVIKKHHELWETAPALDGVPATHNSGLRRKWKKEITAVRKLVFEDTPLGRASIQRLEEIAGAVFSVNLFPDAVSGIVVAGFGEDEYFPRLVAYDVEGVLLNFMKIRKDESRSAEVVADNSAAIIPFAQREMVDLFMEGRDRALGDRIETAFDHFVAGLSDVLVKVAGVKGAAEGTLRRQMDRGSKRLKDEFFDELRQQINERHIAPIITAVMALPKEELAAMAESLVSLTSFKRRVTQDPETVGGPIDVAVISKGDGFVWISHKHYFQPELNHQFFANYFK